jgi:alpha-L-rhamnosidase
MQSDVNAGMPKGPVKYGSDEWLELIVYAIERLQAKGMDFAMHNSAGYSGIGSPALPINVTMKELVWTESSISSNASTMTALYPPFQKMGVYEDIYVLAYPSIFGEEIPWRDAVANVSLSGVTVKTNIATIIDLEQPLRISTSSEDLVFSMKGLWTAQSVSVYRIPETPQNIFDGARDYPPAWTLLASNDSSTWQTISTFTGPALRAMDAPAVGVFSATSANYYKLKSNGPSWVTGVQLTGGARLKDWAIKSHAAPGSIVTDPAIVTNVSASSIINPATVIDVSEHLDSEGILHWRPKNGTYTVVRLGYTVTGQYMPATPDGYDCKLYYQRGLKTK